MSLGTLLLLAFFVGCALAIAGFVVGVTALEIPGLILVVLGGLGQVLVGRSTR